ncbi:elongation factor G, partial [bacterium]|nr:elongation factor G [bacterium]
RRKISLSSSFGFTDYQNFKINIFDTPGYADFVLDALICMQAVEGAVIVLCGVSGVEVQTERTWNFCEELEIPRIIAVNKLDREHTDFERSLASLQKSFNKRFIPVQIPIGKETDFKGVVDLISQKAFIYKEDKSGKFDNVDIPSELKEQVQLYREKLIEMVVETDDALMEKFFEGVQLSEEELYQALRKGTIEGSFVPVVCLSAIKNVGIDQLLDIVIKTLPSPDQRKVKNIVKADDPEKDIDVIVDENQPLKSFIFKTIADPYAGKISLIKVLSGVLKGDSTVYNVNQQRKEKLGQLFFLQGKNQHPTPRGNPGEIIAVAKLKESTTGDSFCDESMQVIIKLKKLPPPAITFAIMPKSKGDEDKISSSLARLAEEDPTLSQRRDKQTNELLVSGNGQLHIEVVVDKLKRKFGVEVTLKQPKVPYKETIKGKAKAQGKYKKQTGGRGQYGDAVMEIEPLPRGQGFEFVDKIFGGAIPRQYIPAVEKGIAEVLPLGILSGNPIVDVRVTLLDGSYHAVDSSEMAFKIAASMGFKKMFMEANPILLEPIVIAAVAAPDDNMGDVIGDLNSRRGKILGVEPKGNYQEIKSQVPMSEMLKYAPDLRSMTGGRGSFTIEFSHYEEVPAHLAAKIIEESGKVKDAE